MQATCPRSWSRHHTSGQRKDDTMWAVLLCPDDNTSVNRHWSLFSFHRWIQPMD